MDTAQLAWVAFNGLLLLISLVVAGVQAAKRPPADPAPTAIHAEQPAPSRPDETWQFTLPEGNEHWMVRR